MCVHSGSQDSERWGFAHSEDFEPVPRLSRFVQAAYEEDLCKPKWPPPGGYGMNLAWIHKRVDYDCTQGCVPPYLIYVDHEAQDIVLAIRGLDLKRESDYEVLLDRKMGQELFDGGYVHHGLLQAARWLHKEESETLSSLLLEHPSYRLILAGHSMGAGIAALLAMLMASSSDKVDGIPRERLQCFAFAPARCMSLSLAVRYADVINCVVLQDDFLPRTTTPLEDALECLCCFPCFLCSGCIRDTCTSEKSMLEDPTRLYAPGRIYHIVNRKLCRWGCFPPEVRTAVPVEGRFDRVVLSCNAWADHSLIHIERESRKALELMVKKENAMNVPTMAKMERQATVRKEYREEHNAAMERASSLKLPRAVSSYGTFGQGSSGQGLAAGNLKLWNVRAKSLEGTKLEEATSSLIGNP